MSTEKAGYKYLMVFFTIAPNLRLSGEWTKGDTPPLTNRKTNKQTWAHTHVPTVTFKRTIKMKTARLKERAESWAQSQVGVVRVGEACIIGIYIVTPVGFCSM